VNFVSVLLACAVLGSLVGCGHKPAYSNINLNRSRTASEPQAPGDQPAQPAPATSSPEASKPDQPPEAGPTAPQTAQSSRPRPVQRPAFLDAVRGEAKDLPGYPGADKLRLEYGPAEGGIEMVWLVQSTHDPMDRIADFFDKAIKSNGWEITTRSRDPEYSEWKMKKGDRDRGGVTVRKDPTRGGAMVIQIARSANPAAKSSDAKK
jgi:hypothetical protein